MNDHPRRMSLDQLQRLMDKARPARIERLASLLSAPLKRMVVAAKRLWVSIIGLLDLLRKVLVAAFVANRALLGFSLPRRSFPLLIALLGVWTGPVQAHEIYTDLKNRAGKSCCDGTDCRPARYRATASGLEMLVGGAWVWVPPSTIEYRVLGGDRGETNGGHWCGEPYEGGFITYCAFLPPKVALSLPGGTR